MSSQAEELLESMSEEDIAVATVDPATEPHIVIGNDRFITVPEQLKRIAVQYDHDIETVTFDCPRYWDGHDLSKMAIYINYRRPDGKEAPTTAKNVRINETDTNIMHFDWTVSGNVTEVKGKLSFLVCAKKTDAEGNEENHWNSELCQDMYISEGLECLEQAVELHPDIITDLLLRMDTAEAELHQWEAAYKTDYDKRMLEMEKRTSTSAMDKHVEDYITENPDVIQDAVDEYMENNDQVVEHVNEFITENMDSLINAGLLEINHKAVIERSGNVAPTVKGNALLDSVKGDSYQKTLSGKNLLPAKLQYTTYKGLNFVMNQDGSVTVTGTPTEICANSLYGNYGVGLAFPAGTYILSGGVSNTVYLRIRIHDTAGTLIHERISTTSGREFEVKEGELIHISMYFNTTDAVDATFYPMITLASEVDQTYEPYCGGTTSPNPDYPQEIQSYGDSGWFDGVLVNKYLEPSNGTLTSTSDAVSGENLIPCNPGDIIKVDYTGGELDIKNDAASIYICYYDKDQNYISQYAYNKKSETTLETTVPTGAAFFRFNIRFSTYPFEASQLGHISVTINGKYAAKIKQVGKNLYNLGDVSGTKYVSKKFTLEPGTYTISAVVTSSDTDNTKSLFEFQYPGENGTIGSVYTYLDRNTRQSATVTIPVTTNRIVGYASSNATKSADDTFTFSDIQIEVGEKATDYEPYTEQTIYIPLDAPLRSIGDIRDEIVYQDGQYGVLRRIGVYTLDDVSKFYTSMVTTITFPEGTQRYDVIIQDITNYKVVDAPQPMLCEQFAVSNKMNQDLGIWYNNNPDGEYMAFRFLYYTDVIGATVDEFKTWIAANPITFQYAYETPIFTPFEDQSPFWDFKSYEGATNIYILGDSENVVPVATMLLPKTVDGSLGNHAIVRTREHEEHIEKTLNEQNDFIQSVLGDGTIRLHVGEDGELEYSYWIEETATASVGEEE